MANQGSFYKCDICGNVAYLVESGGSELVCCGEEMRMLEGQEAEEYSQRMAAV